MIRSDLYDYSDIYILVKGKITVTKGENNDAYNNNNDAYYKKLALKNNAPFISCISKINGILIDNAEDLDIVMSMYNLFECGKNYRKTAGSLFNHYRDEPNSGAVGILNYSIKDSESFNYKTSITGKLEGNNAEQDDTEIAVPLKYLSNFWGTLDVSLINCEISLTLSWSQNFVVNPPIVAINNPTGAALFSVITLSAEEDNKLLDQLKSGFKRTVKWNKYRSELSNQITNNNLNYLIDPAFNNVNRLFVLSLENEDDRTNFSKYYVPKIEIKDYNVLIDGKPFFEIPVKNKEETYEAIIEMSKNNDYTTGNLLDYEYFKDNYKLIAIDLSKQTELEDTDLEQQINFIGKFGNNAIMFFIVEKKEETTFDFSKIL